MASKYIKDIVASAPNLTDKVPVSDGGTAAKVVTVQSIINLVPSAAPVTDITGNAGTSTKLLASKNINGVAFDGSTNITINAVDATARIAATEKGTANGVASLAADGKLTPAQLPSSIVGALVYQDSWNATTNSPTIPAAIAGNKGQYYIVLTAGATNVSGITDWKVGDWLISNGTTWDKIDNTDAVNSVFGRLGAVVAQSGDYTASQITLTPTGDVAAVTVQAGIAELAAEKAPLNSPTLVTPVLGVATGTSFNSITGLASVAPLAPAVTAVVGVSTLAARQDHVHLTNFTITATDIKMDGVQAVGSLVTFPRADHVHPSDTSRAAMASTILTDTITVNTDALIIDSSKRVGVGVTPSAWGLSTHKTIDIGTYGSLVSRTDGISTYLANNIYRKSNGSWSPKVTGCSAAYQQSDNTHHWFSQLSSVGGTDLTLVEQMILDAASNLVVSGMFQSKLGASDTIAAGSNIYLNVDGSTGHVIQQGASNSLDFWRCTGGNWARDMRVSSTGNLLINTTTDDGVNKLQVNGGISFATSTTTSAPAAGGAGALPATPLGYATITINGTARKIAYYA